MFYNVQLHCSIINLINFTGPPGMNGPMDPMNQMDPMGGPMGGPMGMDGPPPPMMGMDPMMDPMMGPMMGPDYIENSEYSPHGAGPHTLQRSGQYEHSQHRRASQVSRQSSSASMELDTVSVKKIEDREDEYSKVKQALLSDMNDFEDELDDLISPYDPHELPSPTPIFPADPLINKSRSLSSHSNAASTSGTGMLAASSPRRCSSSSQFDSILGGHDHHSDLEATEACTTMPPFRPSQNSNTTESRSSISSAHSSSLLDAQHAKSSPFNSTVAKVEDFKVLQQQQGLKKHQNPNLTTHSTTTRTSGISISNTNTNYMEEPFPLPVCLSPPLEDELDLVPLGATAAGLASSGHRKLSAPSSAMVSLAAIDEVPDEEHGSPTTGDGVSRAIKRGKPQSCLKYLQVSIIIIFSVESFFIIIILVHVKIEQAF